MQTKASTDRPSVFNIRLLITTVTFVPLIFLAFTDTQGSLDSQRIVPAHRYNGHNASSVLVSVRTPWLRTVPERELPPFPQWRFVTDRHGPARVSRPAAMASPLHCAGAMEDEALGRPIRRSCEWQLVEVSPLSGGAFAAAFAAERAAWARASAGLDISDPASVSRALVCLETPAMSIPCPLTASQLTALKELLASSYIPPASTATGVTATALLQPLTAAGLVAAVTTVYVTSHSNMDSSVPRIAEYYGAALTPEALALEAIAAANGSSAAVAHSTRPLRALLAAAPAPFAGGVPLRAPSPAALARLPTSSPLLLTLLGDDAHTYYGDGLPTGLAKGNASAPARSAPLSNVLSSREAAAVASFDGRRQSALSVVAAVREAASMSGHYRRVADGLGQLQALPVSGAKGRWDAVEDSLRPPFAPPYSPAYLTSQAAVALTDRLVRLGPSGNAHYGDVMAEGMRSAVRSAAGIAHDDPLGASKSLPLPGLLSEAPPEVRASPEDALGGSWNMSDLPPWLRIPSFVNTAECLHPATASALPSGAPPPSPGDDMYEAPRSILLIGPSHLRNFYDSLCPQLLMSARRGNGSIRGSVNALCKLERPIRIVKNRNVTFPTSKHILKKHVYGDDPSYPYPIPFAFHWMTVAPFRTMELVAEQLLTTLGIAHAHHANPTNESAAVNHPDGIVAAMARNFPHFTHEAMASRNDMRPKRDEAFAYSSLSLRSRRGDFAALKGLFTHVVFAGGVWETTFRDLSMPERTEAAAMAIDLIRELLAPRKIILYNQHSWHPLAGSRAKVATRNVYDGRPFAPFGPPRARECSDAGALTKYRDAHLCAAYGPARARVRKACGAELRRERERGDAAAVAAGFRQAADARRLSTAANSAHPMPVDAGNDVETTVEVFDAFVSTMSGLPAVMSDDAGHHYAPLIVEAITQRILRDHVCPPRFVMAVRSDDEEAGAVGGRPPVDYANSGLPWRFPFPAGVDRVVIRVRTSESSAARMPSLHHAFPAEGKGTVSAEVRDLFPLFKAPLPVVSEGLCRAIFDHPYGDVNSHTRIVRRDPSFGLRGSESDGDGDWWRSVPSALPPTSPQKATLPFIHPSPVQANLFPLNVPPHPYLMAVVRSNPFLPSIMCANIHANGLVAKSDAVRIDGMRTAFGRAAAARGGFISPGDALYKSASLAVYSAPRYNVDPLYFLRTRGDYLQDGVLPSDSCVVDVYGAPRKHDAYTGDSRRLPIHVMRYGHMITHDSCLPAPLVDIRARIAVSAYIHARRPDF